jgi:hypothetical protein
MNKLNERVTLIANLSVVVGIIFLAVEQALSIPGAWDRVRGRDSGSPPPCRETDSSDHDFSDSITRVGESMLVRLLIWATALTSDPPPGSGNPQRSWVATPPSWSPPDGGGRP